MKFFLRLLLFFLLFIFATGVSAQYILNGSAKQNSCNCYTLTTPNTFLTGSVWNSNKINLNNPFDFWFTVYLGCTEGADGIAFILQPISTSVGTAGSGMGFEGVKPSVGITLDTYQNPETSDPAEDHISIQANGNISHGSDLAGPVPISATSSNVEDCQWHRLRISWDPVTRWLRAYFDGVLRVEKQFDMVSTIFGNDPNVYWGFTAATGGLVNLQQFCTALDPHISAGVADLTGCSDAPVSFVSNSESFAPIKTYAWDFGDGSTASGEAPPPHTYAAPGIYKVKLSITGQDGCQADTTRSIAIGSIPSAALKVTDTCEGNQPQVEFTQNLLGVSFLWDLDGNQNLGSPPLTPLTPAGAHALTFTVSSLWGCGPDQSATANFTIKPKPQVSVEKTQSCADFNFEALQSDNLTQIQNWSWSFGDGSTANSATVHHQFAPTGPYEVKLTATATNGCSSDPVIETVAVPQAIAFAGKDTIVITNSIFRLNGDGNGELHWEPSTLLTGTDTRNPETQLSQDQSFILRVTTEEGCEARDTVNVKVFAGPAIYIPTAFTPNGDHRNEVLKPVYVGIKELKQFRVFNRWGQQVFQTRDMGRGWDGTLGGRPVPSGTYVWFVEAVNNLGVSILQKGYVTIIR